MCPEFPFPPGSLGAQQAGCTCDSIEALDPLCELHGIAVMTVIEMQRGEMMNWELKKEQAKQRLKWWVPLSTLIAVVITVVLGSLAEPVVRAALIGVMVAAVTSWMAWNKP